MIPDATRDATEVHSGYLFLPAGRWLLTVTTGVNGPFIRSSVFDSEGCKVSIGTPATSGNGRTTHIHALSHANGGAFRVVARARAFHARCADATVIVEEVTFP
jgi:hypothetical protein